MEPISAWTVDWHKRSHAVSAIGEFLREIIPSWLSPPPRGGWAARRAARRGDVSGEDSRELAREADAVWRHCVDEGQHGEAFPEDAPEKKWRQKPAGDARKRPAGPH
jgi:hypothetical protein